MSPLLSLVMAVGMTPLSGAFRTALEYDRAAFRARPPTSAQLDQVRGLFATVSRALAPGGPPAELVARAKEAGFELLLGQDAGGELWILRELGEGRTGAGFYALRAGALPLCVQAPHEFFDQGTGELALATFAALRASCLCTNTVDRRFIDVAHAEKSVFLAATEGLLEGRRWPLIQLHGFAPGSLPIGVAAVVSEGRRQSMAGAQLQQHLRLESGRVLLYPRDTGSLGGTTNVEGSHARAAGVLFLHLELSPSAREQLIQSPLPLVAALRKVLSSP